jgi:hypothetical protein
LYALTSRVYPIELRIFVTCSLPLTLITKYSSTALIRELPNFHFFHMLVILGLFLLVYPSISNMLPEYLQSSYARYKADTDTFATWLLETANRYGYQPTLSAAVPALKKGKRKGKNDDSDADRLHYSATTKDLQKLAEVVTSSSVTVPNSILTIAKRAIKLRKAVNSWFLGQGDSAQNKRHTHFITTLEQICENLQWKTNQHSKADAKQSPPTPEAQSENEMFRNKFAVLTVEEPQNTAQAPPTPRGPKRIVKVTIVEEDDNESADSYLGQLFFKTLCLLQDLNNIRMFISITWSEYRDKKIDLMNAAVLTDSALQLTRDLVEEVEADWRTSGQRDHIQNIVYNLAVSTRGISAAPSIEIGLPYNKNMAGIAEWCYVPTKVLLESFANVLQDNHQPVFKKGPLGPIFRLRIESGCPSVKNSTKTKSSFFRFCRSSAWSIHSKSRCLLRTRSLEALLNLPRPRRLLCGFVSPPRSSWTFIISCDTVPQVHLETSECLDFASRRLSMTT